MKPKGSKFLFDLRDRYGWRKVVVNSELNRGTKRVNQVKLTVTASHSPAHAGFIN